MMPYVAVEQMLGAVAKVAEAYGGKFDFEDEQDEFLDKDGGGRSKKRRSDLER